MAAAPSIGPVRSAEDLAATADLFRAYEASIETDLCFQGFAEELATLPGKYAPPKGALLLARNGGGRPVGCVALRPAEGDACEMKRLYVAPEGRGLGLGRALAEAAIAEARRIGYRRMQLDTLPAMAPAQALYRELGFEPAPAYYETPISGTIFMSLAL